MQRFFTHPRGLAAMLVRVVAAALTLTLAGLAIADPPMRVARLGYLSGEVTFSPAGESDWVSGTLNRPLITGDRLWADKNGRVELQIGNAVVRLADSTLFTLTNLDVAEQAGDIDLVALDMALNQLAEIDPARAQLVELRYFGGLTIEEAAEAMSISPATVKRHWQATRAWLFEALSGPA